MQSLNTRLGNLERTLSGRLNQPDPTNLELVKLLVNDKSNAALRDMANQRLKAMISAEDPNNPRRPSNEAIMLGGLLNADLEQWAVNEKHRELIRCMYSCL